MTTTKRAKWLAVRETPRNLWRHLGRYVWTSGTYVRERKDPEENARLQQFARTCNGNRAEKIRRAREAKAAS